MKRKTNKIHTGIKMVGHRQLDDLLKKAILPMAECIQLRSALENSVMDWQETCGLGPAGTLRQGLRLLHSRLQTASSSVTEPATEGSPPEENSGPPGMEVFNGADGVCESNKRKLILAPPRAF